MQIHHDAEILGQYTGLTLGLAFGGVDYDKQRRDLEDGVDVLIGTPGRLIDFYKQHVFDLRAVQVLILDEADRMFDLGFIADIRYIMRRLPPPDQRLNLLFSATLAQRVLELAYEHMNDPELMRIEPDKMTVDRVRQVIYYPSMDEKPRLLVGLLRRWTRTRTMIFVNTRRGAEELERMLKANGFNAEAISGDVPQNKRLRMLTRLPQRRARDPDRHRRRLARPAHPGRQPRLQLRPAAGSRGLRAPHRPHRARRRRGRRDQPRLRGLRAVAAGHRGLHRPQDCRSRRVAQELLAEITVPALRAPSLQRSGRSRFAAVAAAVADAAVDAAALRARGSGGRGRSGSSRGGRVGDAASGTERPPSDLRRPSPRLAGEAPADPHRRHASRRPRRPRQTALPAATPSRRTRTLGRPQGEARGAPQGGGDSGARAGVRLDPGPSRAGPPACAPRRYPSTGACGGRVESGCSTW